MKYSVVLNEARNFYANIAKKEELNEDVDILVEMIKLEREDSYRYNQLFAAIFFQSSIKVYKASRGYEKITGEEILSCLTTVIRDAINKYELRGVKFTTFLYKSFRFALNGMFKDRLVVRNRYQYIEYEDNVAYNDNQNIMLNIDTCSKLNKLQKDFLKLTLNNYTVNEIKQELKISLNRYYKIKDSLKALNLKQLLF